MKAVLIHNPSAGAAEHQDAESLQRLIRAAGHEVLYRNCRQPGWEASLGENADVIAVAGGDGTVARVAKRMAGARTPIAPLPLGTANNIANTLGIAGIELAEILQGWASAHRRRFDVGIARSGGREAPFIEGAGLGLFAGTLSQADASETIANLDRRPDARLAYALQMLRERVERFPARRVRAWLDDRDISGDYLLFEVMNTQYVGPNLFLAPKADPGDGQLDVVMLPPAERERLQTYLASWQNGWHRPLDLPSHRGRRLRLEWSGCDLHLDDELWPGGADAPCSLELALEGTSVEFLAPG